MKTSVIIALVIGLGATIWIGSGFMDPEASEPEAQKPPASVSHLDQAPSVRVSRLRAEPHARVIELRGSTEPRRAVDLKSETFGIIEELLVPENTLVRLGEIIARLDEAERDAQLREAKALLKQRKIEHDASITLASKGYRSQTERAASAAALEAAQARVKAAEIELSHAEVTAPFGGFLERHLMDVGDYADRGDPIVRLVELSPLRVVGYANESEVLTLQLGMPGKARLTNGRIVTGRIAFLAQEAEPDTRTFRVELEIDNRDFSTPAGITADIIMTLPPQPAHRVSPALLTLDRDGELGIKIIDRNNKAKFVPVEIIDDEADGIWLSGLPYEVQVITVGQEFAKDGEAVRAIPVTPDAAAGSEADEPAS